MSLNCIILALVCLVGLVGCHPKAESAKPAEAASFDPAPYVKEVESGPLKIRLNLDRTHLRLDEVIHLELEVWAPEEAAVTLPKLETGLEQFRWEPIALSNPELQDDHRLHYSRRILLEPLLILEQCSIKPMEVQFQMADPAGGPPKHYSLETEEVPIQVEMPPDEYWEKLTVDTALSESPMERLARHWTWWPYAVAAILVLGGVVLVVVLRRRRRTVVEPPPIPPDVIALEELRQLVEAHLVEQGDLMGFYNAIQGILRRYIEARFEIHAPERTTEEFLDELRGSHSAIGKHQKLLENFLRKNSSK